MMIKKGQLVSDQEVDLTSHEPVIQLFVQVNATAGWPWHFSPLSSEEHGFMTFTKIELAAFFHKCNDLHPILTRLSGNVGMQQQLTQKDLTEDWLQFEAPGMLIQHLIAPVDPRILTGDHLHGQQKKKASVAATIKIVKPDKIQNYINDLHCDGFDPKIYGKMGYFLRGSIKTDGYSLQLLAYKLHELQSVKYKHYEAELLLDHLTTTTASMSDYLTEVHNVFKSATDVECLLGCTPNEMHHLSYLGLDPGQAFIISAYGLLLQDKTPKISKQWCHQQKKKHGSHGHHNRGSGKGRKKSIC